MATEVLRTGDVEETAAVLSAMYGQVAITSEGSTGGMRIERDQVGVVTFDRIILKVGTDFDVDPGDQLGITQVRGGTLRYSTDQADQVAGRGDLMVPGPDRPFLVRAENLDEETTMLPRTLLAQVAATLRDPEVEPIRLTDAQPVSASAAATFNHLRTYAQGAIRSLRNTPTDKPAGEPSDGPTDSHAGGSAELMIASLERLVAAGVLSTFPNTAVTVATRTDRHDAHPDTLRRAIAFIESHPHLPLTVVDIARAAYVTPRALQLTFRRHLDTTPMRYLRRVRLDCAHTELTNVTPGDALTVTRVAQRWGFTRPSTFTAAYHALYGRPPHLTLRDTTTRPTQSRSVFEG